MTPPKRMIFWKKYEGGGVSFPIQKSLLHIFSFLKMSMTCYLITIQIGWNTFLKTAVAWWNIRERWWEDPTLASVPLVWPRAAWRWRWSTPPSRSWRRSGRTGTGRARRRRGNAGEDNRCHKNYLNRGDLIILLSLLSLSCLIYPTPRNALSVGWFVRSSVTCFTPFNAHNISATKRATGYPLVSKRPDFWGLFRCLKNIGIWEYLGNKKS